MVTAQPLSALLGLLLVLGLSSCGIPSPESTTSANVHNPNLADSGDRASEAAAVQRLGEPIALWAQDPNSLINIRSGPSPEASIVTTASVGDRGRAFNMKRDRDRLWYFVRLESGVEGWLSGELINFTDTLDSLERPFVVMPDQIPVYAEPDPNAAVVKTLPGGEVVTASQVQDSDHGAWLYIGDGWVSDEFVFRPACIQSDGYPLQVVAVGGAAVRAEPDPEAPLIRALQGGEAVFPTETTDREDGTWFAVYQGWVKDEFLFYPSCDPKS